MRFFEYFDEFRGLPWLDLILKLDVVRQASIPSRDCSMKRQYTPLRCVKRVHDVELLAANPTDNRIPMRIVLDVQDVGKCVRELPIFIPTAA